MILIVLNAEKCDAYSNDSIYNENRTTWFIFFVHFEAIFFVAKKSINFIKWDGTKKWTPIDMNFREINDKFAYLDRHIRHTKSTKRKKKRKRKKSRKRDRETHHSHTRIIL